MRMLVFIIKRYIDTPSEAGLMTLAPLYGHLSVSRTSGLVINIHKYVNLAFFCRQL